MGELKSDFIGRTCDVVDGKVYRVIDHNNIIPAPISSITPSADNQTILICTLDSNLRLMDRVNGQMLNTFSGMSTILR
jgi:hypothetical protein